MGIFGPQPYFKGSILSILVTAGFLFSSFSLALEPQRTNQIQSQKQTPKRGQEKQTDVDCPRDLKVWRHTHSVYVNPELFLRGEIWVDQATGETYRLLNIGSHEQDKISDPIVEKLQRENPSARVQIEFPFGQLRLQILKMIYDGYRKEKPYLTEADFFNLKIADNLGLANEDFFILIRQDPAKASLPVKMEDILPNLVMVGRLNYSERQVPASLFPSSAPPIFAELQLPHGLRFRTDTTLPWMSPLIQERFSGRKIYEITRLFKFGNVDVSMVDRFIQNIISKIGSLGDHTGVTIASVDAVTQRRFRRFGFKLLGPLFPDKPGSDEVLTYIDPLERE